MSWPICLWIMKCINYFTPALFGSPTPRHILRLSISSLTFSGHAVTPKQDGNRDYANSGQNYGEGFGAASLEPLGVKVDCSEHGSKVHDPTAVDVRCPNADPDN